MINLIPYPNELTLLNGEHIFDKSVTINIDAKLQGTKEFCYELLGKYFAVSEGNEISVIYDGSYINEQYSLVIGNNITITASSHNGVVYGLQTLRQLGRFDKKGNKTPFVEIMDKPLYRHRGFMLDVCRHYFDVKVIKDLLDMMSLFKLNIFHWHLTDDQGFRIQIDKYDRLNEIGSYRNGTLVHDGKSYNDGKKYGGYFTKDEIKEIVRYATKLGITVIPEVEIPGHTMAIVASYPELGCKGEPIDVWQQFGVSKDIICGGNAHVYELICGILDEVCELFPSEYIHLGGDEAPKDNWKNCPRCQAKIKELELNDEEQLQGYLFNYFADYLKSKGKKVIGWNECLNDNLSSDIVCQHWTPRIFGRNHKTAKHINEGRQFIVSDFVKTYLDYPYAMTSLRKVYNFSPITTIGGVKRTDNIMGSECHMWTEWVDRLDKLQFNLYPRMLAFAESVWRIDKLPYQDFVNRLQDFYNILDKLGVQYNRNATKRIGLFKRLSIIGKQFTNDAFVELNEQKQGEDR